MAIIVVAVLLAVVVIKDHLLKRQDTSVRQRVNQPLESSKQIANGANLSSFDVDWKQSKQTLVLAISSTCHYCTESATFYKRLMQSKKTTRIVAVLPQPVQDGREYLERLGVSVDDVRQLGFDKLGVRGTPTLLLVDSSGVVKSIWIGKLKPEQETAVLDAL